MHCAEPRQFDIRFGVLLTLALLAGCSSTPPPSVPAAAQARPAAAPTSPAALSTGKPAISAAPSPVGRPARNWDEWRHAAALRMVEANRAMTYVGEVPEPLLAIPILEIELNADGSVRNIVVMRRPTQALDTVQLAIDAVHRAAPFGNVSHLPRPWKFTEVFLFADDRRFKPRTLDL